MTKMMTKRRKKRVVRNTRKVKMKMMIAMNMRGSLKTQSKNVIYQGEHLLRLKFFCESQNMKCVTVKNENFQARVDRWWTR